MQLNIKRCAGLACVLGLGLGLGAQAALPDVIYVDDDAPAGGDGSSWATAYTQLQDALTGASAGSDIRVAGGVYCPDRSAANPTGTGERTASFELVSGAVLRGGYAGYGAPEPDERSYLDYPTVLSGDLAGDDGPDFQFYAENSYHVVTGVWLGPATVVEGFTITGGNADGVAPDDCGAGIYSLYASFTLTNCTVWGNYAAQDGGGVANFDGSSPAVTNCVFSANSALRGGALYNENSSPNLTNCTLVGNQAGEGGGVLNDSGSPTLVNCILWDNQGAQFVNLGLAEGTLRYSNIQGGFAGPGNTSAVPRVVDAEGGDLRLRAGSPCIDAGDATAVPFGVDGDRDGNPRLHDDPGKADTGVSGGEAVVDMGAYEFQGVTPPPGVIFVDNSATGLNDGCTWDDAYTELGLALEAATPGDQLWVAGSDVPYAPGSPASSRENTFQLVDGVALYGGFAGGELNLAERDLEANPTTLSGDLNGDDEPGVGGAHPSKQDNCYHVVSAGNTDANTVLDGFIITGGNANAAVFPHDSGAGFYNVAGSPTIRNCTVTANLADYNGAGMYNRQNSSPEISDCFFTDNVAGDYGGGMCNRSGSHPGITNCTFSDNQAEYGGGMSNAESSSVVVDCVFSDNAGCGMSNESGASPQVTGCTFSGNPGGGMRNWSQATPSVSVCRFEGNLGSGMYNWDNSAPQVSDCTFSLNYADHGGGVYNDHSSPTLSDCLFEENSADFEGGAFYNYSGTADLTRCVFFANVAASNGGGVYTEEGVVVLVNCVLNGNQANRGGACYSDGDSPILVNCACSGNLAQLEGGGFYQNQGDPVFTNCTLAGNHAEAEGGGVYCSGACTPVVTSCVFWGNTDSQNGQQSSQVQGGTFDLNYCCVQDWTGSLGGVGNTGSDPLLMNATGADDIVGTLDDDLRLSSTSLSIDTGDPHFTPILATTDLEGHARVLCDQVDRGAYEFGIGDYDCDHDVDLNDYELLNVCLSFSGPGVTPPFSECLEVFDFDADADLDLYDAAGFARTFSAP